MLTTAIPDNGLQLYTYAVRSAITATAQLLLATNILLSVDNETTLKIGQHRTKTSWLLTFLDHPVYPGVKTHHCTVQLEATWAIYLHRSTSVYHHRGVSRIYG